jgi:hypothetical protein
MRTVPVFKENLTINEVSGALRNSLGLRYHVLAERVSLGRFDKPEVHQPDAITVSKGSDRIWQVQVRIAHSSGETNIRLDPVGMPGLRLVNRFGIARKVHRALLEAPSLGEDAVWRDSEIKRRLRHTVALKARARKNSEQWNFVSGWYGRMERAEELSDHFKLHYYLWLSLTSLAAATVPVLIAFAGSSDVASASVMRGVAAGLGVFVAATTSVIGVVQLGNRWRVYRTYSQSLEEAGWDYLASHDAKAAYPNFVAAVTTARRSFEREYLTQVAILQQSQAPADDKSGPNTLADSVPTADNTDSDPATRLQRLEELFAGNLLSPEEYEAKRAEIISTI